jgi:hypothetical protein
MKRISVPSIGFLDTRYVNEEDWFLLPPADDWYDPTGGLPVDPDVGDRYVSDATAEGWEIDHIYEWDGDEWIESEPEEGWMIWMLFELMFYVFFSGGWMEVGSTTFVELAGDTMTGDLNVWANTRLGHADNHLKVSSTGVVTLVGTAKRDLTLRPEINVDEIKKNAVPNQVQVGVFFGYSMPVWTADSHEELFFKQSVPGRWDGASDITLHVLVAISQVEDIGDYLKFQMSWNNVADNTDVIPATTHDVTAEQAVLIGRTAQYSVYELIFTIDWDIDGEGNEIQDHDLLACRLRRVDATNPDVTGEIIVLDWHNHFTVDKMFKAL